MDGGCVPGAWMGPRKLGPAGDSGGGTLGEGEWGMGNGEVSSAPDCAKVWGAGGSRRRRRLLRFGDGETLFLFLGGGIEGFGDWGLGMRHVVAG